MLCHPQPRLIPALSALPRGPSAQHLLHQAHRLPEQLRPRPRSRRATRTHESSRLQQPGRATDESYELAADRRGQPAHQRCAQPLELLRVVSGTWANNSAELVANIRAEDDTLRMPVADTGDSENPEQVEKSVEVSQDQPDQRTHDNLTYNASGGGPVRDEPETATDPADSILRGPHREDAKNADSAPEELDESSFLGRAIEKSAQAFSKFAAEKLMVLGALAITPVLGVIVEVAIRVGEAVADAEAAGEGAPIAIVPLGRFVPYVGSVPGLGLDLSFPLGDADRDSPECTLFVSPADDGPFGGFALEKPESPEDSVKRSEPARDDGGPPHAQDDSASERIVRRSVRPAGLSSRMIARPPSVSSKSICHEQDCPPTRGFAPPRYVTWPPSTRP